MPLAMDKDALTQFLASDFSQVDGMFTIESVDEMEAVIRLNVGEEHLRPGGTVSGPSMFALADVSVYLAILAMIGPKALSVTTNCSIDFMRKPEASRDLLCHVRLLKMGRVLAVGDCLLFSDGSDQAVARASLTYSIPPK
ncbi:thioesterase [Aestuarium zhoushanense]|nr:thioesterase [Aestuarium zhoushanense]